VQPGSAHSAFRLAIENSSAHGTKHGIFPLLHRSGSVGQFRPVGGEGPGKVLSRGKPTANGTVWGRLGGMGLTEEGRWQWGRRWQSGQQHQLEREVASDEGVDVGELRGRVVLLKAVVGPEVHRRRLVMVSWSGKKRQPKKCSCWRQYVTPRVREP
jgi:hypothetical protein